MRYRCIPSPYVEWGARVGAIAAGYPSHHYSLLRASAETQVHCRVCKPGNTAQPWILDFENAKPGFWLWAYGVTWKHVKKSRLLLTNQSDPNNTVKCYCSQETHSQNICHSWTIDNDMREQSSVLLWLRQTVNGTYDSLNFSTPKTRVSDHVKSMFWGLTDVWITQVFGFGEPRLETLVHWVTAHCPNDYCIWCHLRNHSFIFA